MRQRCARCNHVLRTRSAGGVWPYECVECYLCPECSGVGVTWTTTRYEKCATCAGKGYGTKSADAFRLRAESGPKLPTKFADEAWRPHDPDSELDAELYGDVED